MDFYLINKAFAAASATELGEAETFGDLISLFWAWGAKVIIGVSVLTLIVGAIFYITSNGNDEKMDEAKHIMGGAIIATIIVIMSGVFQKLLTRPTEGIEAGGAKLSYLPNVIGNVSLILLGTVASLSILMLIFNGFKYITSTGEQEKVESAKRGFKLSILGLVLAVSAYFIINLVIKIFT